MIRSLFKLISTGLYLSLSTQLFAAELTLKQLKGPLYVVEDDYFYKENSMVYIGKDTVTIIGATWSNDTALLLDKEIKKITKKKHQFQFS